MEWIFQLGFTTGQTLSREELVGKGKRKGDVLKGERKRGGMASEQLLTPKGILYGPSAGIKTRNCYAREK